MRESKFKFLPIFLSGFLAAVPVLADQSVTKSASVYMPGFSEPQEVTYEIIDGEAIFEGDIILGTVDHNGDIINNDEFSTESIVINAEKYRWPNATVPYKIDFSESSIVGQRVLDAINHWESFTPLNFEKYNSSIHNDYIEFVLVDNACRSSIGRQGGRQEIKLDSDGDCSFGSTVHEIGHAMGLSHEQARWDRDEWVEIHWENIEDWKGHNFERRNHADSGPYDYGSIMHYRANAFSKNGLPTITALKPLPPGVTMGQRNGLSAGDIAVVTAMYTFESTAFNLSSACDSESDVLCKVADVNNDGRDDIIRFYRGQPTYVDPYTGISYSNPTYGDVTVAINNGMGFSLPQLWHGTFCVGNQQCDVGDMNNDGRADIFSFVRDSAYDTTVGDVYVAESTGASFSSARLAHPYFCVNSKEKCHVGHFDTDGFVDLLSYKGEELSGASTVDVYKNYQRYGESFRRFNAAPYQAASLFCMRTDEICMTGDFNGDGIDDIITFHHGAYSNNLNQVYVYISDGYFFNYTGAPWHSNFCNIMQTCMVADVNGDGADDIVALRGYVYPEPGNPLEPRPTHLDDGDVSVAYSNGLNGFGPELLVHGDMCKVPMNCFVADLDYDIENEILDLDFGIRYDLIH